ncbi:hypothetical protein SAICODRAFT_179043 [Saitoella complicata NRRL Y-17804]|uniref:uncharacterized protein n=1 Tax=Saitoella complicata (strain BCRC 22490 / CBS 7301 / JCM 7358 / NBRC 10748 / NRRL Y-17804) TaxID=698492 RepID=UPI000867CD16|nr:uncharacterized protein SAICODRAFT_179043 [Saitoella complicata NRRL Y-17804]ODQ50191.1 hypothetical protein SAICODRAFT_179043 [Saitoella complicata NRRL Y-17804]
MRQAIGHSSPLFLVFICMSSMSQCSEKPIKARRHRIPRTDLLCASSQRQTPSGRQTTPPPLPYVTSDRFLVVSRVYLHGVSSAVPLPVERR